jgi:uncharacterized protein YkwD
MISPGHRANILDNHYDVLGVGTYCTTSDCWNTQDLDSYFVTTKSTLIVL